MKTFNFKSKTQKFLPTLRIKMLAKTIYPTLGHFYREIEMLKFPYMKDMPVGHRWNPPHGRNVYSQQQYESIVDYCVSQGWVTIVQGSRKNSYKVIVNAGNICATPEKRTKKFAEHKAIQIARNSTYGAFTETEVNNDFKVELSLDPNLNWVIQTYNGKSYLSIKK
jgi:hypothetical protein